MSINFKEMMVKRELWSKKLVNSWLTKKENNSNKNKNRMVAIRLRWAVLVRKRSPVPPNKERKNSPKRLVAFLKLNLSQVLLVVDSMRTISNS